MSVNVSIVDPNFCLMIGVSHARRNFSMTFILTNDLKKKRFVQDQLKMV